MHQLIYVTILHTLKYTLHKVVEHGNWSKTIYLHCPAYTQLCNMQINTLVNSDDARYERIVCVMKSCLHIVTKLLIYLKSIIVMLCSILAYYMCIDYMCRLRAISVWIFTIYREKVNLWFIIVTKNITQNYIMAKVWTISGVMPNCTSNMLNRKANELSTRIKSSHMYGMRKNCK